MQDQRVCIVTGAAQGLGREFAVRLAEKGAAVVCADIQDDGGRETVQQIEKSGGRAMAIRTDVTSVQSTEAMARRVASEFDGIDALVNNAGIYAGLKLRALDELDVEEWDRVMAVNVRGVWLATRAVLPYMRQRGKGKIVNIASGVAINGAPFLLHYVASKGAVVSLTRSMARELGQYNICVNSVAPGLTMTQASIDIFPPESIAKNFQSRCIQREEQPEDVAGAVAFLVSDEADLITGQMLVVNGGQAFH